MREACERYSRWDRAWIAGGMFCLSGCLIWGCASPGPPRPPSLFLPQVVTDLSAVRRGNAVELQFTVSGLSSDGQPLRARSLAGVLCRRDAQSAPCLPVDAAATAQPLPVPGPGLRLPVIWTDALPEPLRTGAPKAISYEVELRTPSGASAGYSDPVYTAAGAAPPPVRDFRAEGTRLGVLLRWVPVSGAGEVILGRREPETAAVGRGGVRNSPAPAAAATAKGKAHPRSAHVTQLSAEKHGRAEAGFVSLSTGGATAGGPAARDGAAGAVLDNSIQPGVPYLYTAVRRQQVQAGGRLLVLESEPSAAVAITWQDVYPPPPPTDLKAAGYEVPAVGGSGPAGYAIDLVWEPVEDSQLAGYLVFRQAVGEGGKEPGARLPLTSQPLRTPGFHDADASPQQRYLYSVVAVGANGQSSAAATTVVEPHLVP